MRLNRLGIGMHADFHRKSFDEERNPDSRAENNRFAARRIARTCAAR